MIDALRQAGLVGPLDEHLARVLGRLVPSAPAEVLAAAAAASHVSEGGHICLDLAELAGQPVRDAEGKPLGRLRWPTRKAWVDALRSCALVSDGEAVAPLVLDARDRLYLYRYWQHERSLADRLARRIEGEPPRVDAALLREGLSRLFGAPLGGPAGPADGQRLAALLAVLLRFCVITGGPGTGKTTTVAKILALLVEQARGAGEALHITLLAPTGKAAARLSAAIGEARDSLACDPEVRAAIPDEASTIHRGLGTRWSGPQAFWHHADNPLPTDVVLVDEASMVDLALMSRLVAAVPPAARLILLGDREQLASVAPGAVLADICNAGESPGLSEPLRAQLARDTGDRLPKARTAPKTRGIWDGVAHLTHSFRFGPDSGIGALARSIVGGDADAALACLDDDAFADVRRVALPEGGGLEPLGRLAARGYAPFARERRPVEMIAALGSFRILCAHRVGPYGVAAANDAVAAALHADGLLEPDGRWYAGQPILIGENSYSLGLFNGDVGVIAADPGSGALRAWFVDPRGQPRTFAPARLPSHETVFAMTVHKSQGSEFDDVVVLLPEHLSRVLTRELLYTAVTRARRSVTIFGSADAVRHAVSQRVERTSGLRERLWGAATGS